MNNVTVKSCTFHVYTLYFTYINMHSKINPSNLKKLKYFEARGRNTLISEIFISDEKKRHPCVYAVSFEIDIFPNSSQYHWKAMFYAEEKFQTNSCHLAYGAESQVDKHNICCSASWSMKYRWAEQMYRIPNIVNCWQSVTRETESQRLSTAYIHSFSMLFLSLYIVFAFFPVSLMLYCYVMMYRQRLQ
jgi:hypothetical protein